MSDLAQQLLARLGDGASAVRDAIAKTLATPRDLAVVFPSLPRRLGRSGLGGGMFAVGAARVDLDGWRRCDAGACALLAAAAVPEATLWDLYEHGDLEERAMLLRSLQLLPVTAATVRLLAEVQRTNMVMHVEAALCDGNLLARARGQHGFGETECNRLLLKLAFLDLPLRRALGAEMLANAALSRMLQDLATEREAAGRAVWRDTWRMIGRAPTAGTAARLVGGLEHGDDGVRLAAAEGLLALARKDLQPFAQERLPREPRAAVRALLQRLCS
jgi:hypothetical protein